MTAPVVQINASGVDAGFANDDDSYQFLFGMSGPNSDGTGALLKRFASFPLARVPRAFINSDHQLALADSKLGILTTTLPSPVIFKLIPMALLGFPRNIANPLELIYLFQRRGDGALIVTPSQYRGQVADATAMVALNSPTPAIGDWVQRLDDTTGGFTAGSIYMLSSGAAGTAGNWIKQTASNRPRIAWGAVANQAAMVALSGATPGDWCTRTDVSGLAFKLETAPFSVSTNWIVQTTNSVAGIIVNDPDGLDPQFMSIKGGAVSYVSSGLDEWDLG